jgi:hypothetical protein
MEGDGLQAVRHHRKQLRLKPLRDASLEAQAIEVLLEKRMRDNSVLAPKCYVVCYIGELEGGKLYHAATDRTTSSEGHSQGVKADCNGFVIVLSSFCTSSRSHRRRLHRG